MTSFDKSVEHGRSIDMWALRLPAEHGATVVFAFSASLSIRLLDFQMASSLVVLATVLIFLYARSTFLASGIAMVAAILLLLTNQNLALLFPLAFMYSGLLGLKHLQVFKQSFMRQTLGMLGLAIVPLSVALMLKFDSTTLLISATFLYAVMLAVGIVQFYTNSKAPLAIFLSLCLFLYVLFVNTLLAATSIAPFLVQCVYLKIRPEHSFKTFGILETLCLSIVFIQCWIML